MRPFIHIILFTNLFYGLCAVALAIENNRQLGLPLNHWAFYVFICCSTIFFYNLSYTHDPSPSPANQRAIWLHRHKKLLDVMQGVCLVALVLTATWYFWLFRLHYQFISVWQVLLVTCIPVVAFLLWSFISGYFQAQSPSAWMVQALHHWWRVGRCGEYCTPGSPGAGAAGNHVL